jgi:NAD(P)H dehydrogenase (quinone)
MIIVTGGNGKLGRGIVERLLQLVPAERIGVSVREPERAADLAARGVSVRRGDYADPAGLAAAFAGAERVLLVSASISGPERVRLHRNAVDAAKAAGAPHVLYTSIVAPDPASPFAPTVDHVATEEYLRASGLRWTFLRNSLYMETVPALVGGALAGGAVEGPADGPIAWAARADLAEATANLLAAGGHLDEAVELSGGEAVDLDALAAIVGRLTGRHVERRTLSDAAYREQLLAFGFPPAGADAFLSIFAASREGRFAAVSPALGRLLGRAPTTAEELLRAAQQEQVR